MGKVKWAGLVALLLLFALPLCVYGLPSDLEEASSSQELAEPQEPRSNTNGLLRWDEATLLLTDPEVNCEAFLSTQAAEDLVDCYPQADLHFRIFSGDRGLDCRAVLTLYNPCLEESQMPLPEDCRIYSLSKEGELLDVTSLFTYVEKDEDGNQIDGWRTKVWTLGSYVISECPLED